MTEREIKLEIVKAALMGCQAKDSLRCLFEWVMEDPEKESEYGTEVDNKPISSIVNYIKKYRYRSGGYAVRLERIFKENDIKTVGDLLRFDRSDFLKLRDVGKGSITRIDDALEELYSITNW